MIAALLIAIGMLCGTSVALKYIDYRRAVETDEDQLRHRLLMRELDQQHESRVLGIGDGREWMAERSSQR